MLASGLCTSDPAAAPSHCWFTFWGEWEPPSRVTKLPEGTDPAHPRWLHEPVLSSGGASLQNPGRDLPCQSTRARCGWDSKAQQNTDPFVFGHYFHYALCQQTRRGAATRLAALEEADMILFGSHRHGSFVLDTVFVVAQYHDLHPDDRAPHWESELHRTVTLELIKIPACGLRLYRGKSWSVDQPFSFVPCSPWKIQPVIFRRPIITPRGPLRDLIRPTMKQAFYAPEVHSTSQVRAAWHEVVAQVLAQGCALATAVDEPKASDHSSGRVPPEW